MLPSWLSGKILYVEWRPIHILFHHPPSTKVNWVPCTVQTSTVFLSYFYFSGFSLRGSVQYGPDWSWTHYVEEHDYEFLILPPLPPKCDYKYSPPCPDVLPSFLSLYVPPSLPILISGFFNKFSLYSPAWAQIHILLFFSLLSVEITSVHYRDWHLNLIFIT